MTLKSNHSSSTAPTTPVILCLWMANIPHIFQRNIHSLRFDYHKLLRQPYLQHSFRFLWNICSTLTKYSLWVLTMVRALKTSWVKLVHTQVAVYHFSKSHLSANSNLHIAKPESFVTHHLIVSVNLSQQFTKSWFFTETINYAIVEVVGQLSLHLISLWYHVLYFWKVLQQK